LGSTLTDEEAVKMVEIADYKQNGVIEFDEFVALVTSQGAAGEGSISKPQSPSVAVTSSAVRPPVLLSDEVEEAFSNVGWREKPRESTLCSSKSPVRSPAVSAPVTRKVSAPVTLPSVPELGAPVFLSDEVEEAFGNSGWQEKNRVEDSFRRQDSRTSSSSSSSSSTKNYHG
jgi:hypothetical protein